MKNESRVKFTRKQRTIVILVPLLALIVGSVLALAIPYPEPGVAAPLSPKPAHSRTVDDEGVGLGWFLPGAGY